MELDQLKRREGLARIGQQQQKKMPGYYMARGQCRCSAESCFIRSLRSEAYDSLRMSGRMGRLQWKTSMRQRTRPSGEAPMTRDWRVWAQHLSLEKYLTELGELMNRSSSSVSAYLPAWSINLKSNWISTWDSRLLWCKSVRGEGRGGTRVQTECLGWKQIVSQSVLLAD